MPLFVLLLEGKVPFLLQKMRKNPHSQWSELLEYIGKKCSVMNLEVEASLASQSHDFSENKPYIFDKERIDKGVDNFSMLIPWMFLQNDVILNKEMRNVIIKIDCF